jgi:hypothetical protein
MALEKGKSPFLLHHVAQDADINHGGMQVAGYLHVVHRDQARIAYLEFTADDLADLALQ